MVQDRQQVKDQLSYISGFVTSNTSPEMATVFHVWSYGRFIDIQNNLRRKKLHQMN